MSLLMRANETARTSSLLDDDACWKAVKRRDRAADGAFFCSVRTTGVYCRPSCAARLPRRGNVAFHKTCADAERAGFRPCKRCRPNEPTLAETHSAAVARACRLIEEAEEAPSLDALAQSAGMSRFHFHRVFKAVTGVTPKAYAAGHRGKRVREELAASNTVTEAIYGAGFNSNGRFYAAASDLLGMTPTQFRAGGSGHVIRFAVGQCSLGAILVAATDKGVCAIEFGDDPEALVRGLQDRFPNARLVGGDEKFEQLVAKVVGFIEAPGGAHGRVGLGLSLGCCPQASPAGTGEGGVTRALPVVGERAPAASARSLVAQVAALDWACIAAQLDAYGCAPTGRLLTS